MTMSSYHKIQSLFKRNPDGSFIESEWSRPEFELLAELDWMGHEKIDGTNIQLWNFRPDDAPLGLQQLPIYGKTYKASLHGGSHQILLDTHAKLKQFVEDSQLGLCEVGFFGELYGAKIQSGGHYIPDGFGFCLFDVFIEGNWQSQDNVKSIAETYGITCAPLVATHDLFTWVGKIREKGYLSSILHEGARNEGVILRPILELQDRCGQRIISKLKFKDFK